MLQKWTDLSTQFFWRWKNIIIDPLKLALTMQITLAPKVSFFLAQDFLTIFAFAFFASSLLLNRCVICPYFSSVILSEVSRWWQR